jgi:glucose-1-phosphate cytidylyltransferase
MKVVIFCGGLGLRLREHSETVPKPMVKIGYRPILWHSMRYYAHFGYQDFVLCLGYKADIIKDYFLRYDETLSNDFVLSNGARDVELLRQDITDWRISFHDTGLRASIGERLRAVRNQLQREEIFLANYGDVLTDAPIADMVEDFRHHDKVAAFVSVQPATYTFHLVGTDDEPQNGEARLVSRLDDVRTSDLWINGGHFIFRREIFDYLRPGEDLVAEPLHRLIADGQLVTYKHKGFWAPLDTLKDLELLQSEYESGAPPWALWDRAEAE